MSKTLSAIAAELPKLSQPELRELKQRIQILLVGDDKASAPEDWLLEGLTAEMRRRGLWPNQTRIPNQLLPRKYEETATRVREYLRKGLGVAKPRTSELLALGRLAASVLADYLLQLNRPVTPRTLLDGASLIPQALDAAFPGYWASAALGVCLKLRKE